MVFCPLFPRKIGCFVRFFAAKVHFFSDIRKCFAKKMSWTYLQLIFLSEPLTSRLSPHHLIAPQGRVEGRPYKRCPFASKRSSAVRMNSWPSMMNFFTPVALLPFSSLPSPKMFSTDVAERLGSTDKLKRFS